MDRELTVLYDDPTLPGATLKRRSAVVCATSPFGLSRKRPVGDHRGVIREQARSLLVAVLVVVAWLCVGGRAFAEGSFTRSATARGGAPNVLPSLRGLPLLEPSVQVAGASSHALNGSNRDWGRYLYRDRHGAYVLMQASGPGAITRLWMTRAHLEGDEHEIGRVEIFFDGERHPRVDLPATELFSGTVAPFLAPLCGNEEVSSGGDYCEVRMPYRSSVQIAITGEPPYFNVSYETYPAGTQVDSFDPRSPRTLRSARRAVALLSRAGQDPGILPLGRVVTGRATLAAGQRTTLADITHRGAVRAVSISLARGDDATLQNVWLEARWDGSALPAVSAPLADLFLTGAGERSPARGLLAGYDPTRHTGYLYFPMPFARSARFELVNRSGSPVTARWQIQQSATDYARVGTQVGEFHATFAHDSATRLGYDYVMLKAREEGKVVGVSFTEAGPLNRFLTLFMEGDERIYIDRSNTPQIYGTGTEDFFDGGYYYFPNGPFTLPSHGLTDKENAPAGGRTSQYRLLLDDPWPFRDGIRVGIEHGAGDGIRTAARSVVFWYGTDKPATRLTDTIDLASTASIKTSGYRATGTHTLTRLTGFYEGDFDGNLSSAGNDSVLPPPPPGSQPPPSSSDPMHESVRATVFTHPIGTIINFSIRVAPDNHGVILRRRLDQAVYGQRAQVLVDGHPARVWFTAGRNTSKRWADSDFALPSRLTTGKQRLAIELRVLSSQGAPARSPTGWSDSTYQARSILAQDN